MTGFTIANGLEIERIINLVIFYLTVSVVTGVGRRKPHRERRQVDVRWTSAENHESDRPRRSEGEEGGTREGEGETDQRQEELVPCSRRM